MKKRPKLVFEKKITGLLLVVIFIILTSSFLVYRNLDAIVSDISEEVTPDETLIVIKDIINDITIAENSAKTYSLNQQAEYLNEFNTKTEEVEEKLNQLREITGDNVKRFKKVELLDSLIDEKNQVLEEFLIFQDRYRAPEVIDKMIDKVERVNNSEDNKTNTAESEEEKKSFFKRLFNKRKEKKNEKEAENKAQEELEEIDEELTLLKNKEARLSEDLRSKELDLISKDQAIMHKIREVVQSIEKEESESLKKGILMAEEKSSKTYLLVGVYSIITCLFLIFAGWAVFIYVRKNETYKVTIQKAKKETDLKNQEITSSINYAKRIQSAILPDLRVYNNILPKSFLFYQPKDIVAGDFYWVIKQDDEVIYFAVADCTGHGVPGAMVSVVCHNALNRSVREFGLNTPAKILKKTREIVIDTLEEREDVIYDGMDIAFCKLNLKTGELEYAGANNSLYIIPKSSAAAFIERNNFKGAKHSVHDGKSDIKLIEIKADKQPIARYHKMEPFTNHNINLQEGDSIYMFTDGYPDQFGGEKNKKFNYRRFRETLLQNAQIDMNNQKNELVKSLKDWMNEMEQIDDICIVGIQF